MTKPLEILLVEDSEDDASLIGIELKRGGIVANIRRVENRHAFTNSLKKETFDVVLCDYKVPGLNGEEALLLIRNVLGPDIPVVFVSGGIGEETAVDLMRAGA